ncbi:metal-sulfur cluster assembly factor [Parapedobacter indicus]|uniref:Metal-sulfur cluster biosynthetic enzyme n=1 Tax=Parapedobacter indicus TaxID=1477437 RepID=A0A1I3N498_9SPHI|nr:metal-sulfur cluster assembly factor [Parapedobacter indicus]PPL00875.1 metal-sulfur cluster biosynthetic enzyme [Parapedobacter indicus]SFJ04118.1 Metal-sulfur cluster biosynthetic enzyme [Parapedobacter indicus]
MEIKLNDPFAAELLKAQTALMQVIDPELYVNIIDLGLVYGVDFSDAARVKVTMTLSTPGCPMGEAITNGVENILGVVFPKREIEVEVVWEPRWNYHMITDAGKAQMGLE